MRNTIVASLALLVWIMGALILIGGIVYGFMAMQMSFVMGLGIIIGAVIYAVIFCGFMFLFLDIRDNTKRTAELMEKMAAR